MFESDKVKGSFFLSTLLEQIDNIVDNFATSNLTSFVNIEPKMLNIADQHALSATESAAYSASNGQRSSNKGTDSATKTHGTPNKCTWCRNMAGHLWDTPTLNVGSSKITKQKSKRTRLPSAALQHKRGRRRYML